LTWSPQNFHYDGKWHNIRITVRNRDFHLSYRRGHFADKPQTLAPRQRKFATLITGDTKQPVTAPDVHSAPLLFQASVHLADHTRTDADYIPLRPAAPATKGTSAYRIDYSLSTAGLSTATTDGRATVFFAAIALNSDGNRIDQTFDRVRFPLQPNNPPRKLQVAQQINLPKSGDFLALTVWDAISGHLGTLQIPVTVSATSK
ncbi:MAG TPA: hypothetical protein VFW30_04680, partial [Bryocella sp.]|nr:hypothetical protein [Bryocella sp.]